MGTQNRSALLFGGARRDRTADLLHAMQALSQLSYSPTERETLRSWRSRVKEYRGLCHADYDGSAAGLIARVLQSKSSGLHSVRTAGHARWFSDYSSDNFTLFESTESADYAPEQN